MTESRHSSIAPQIGTPDSKRLAVVRTLQWQLHKAVANMQAGNACRNCPTSPPTLMP